LHFDNNWPFSADDAGFIWDDVAVLRVTKNIRHGKFIAVYTPREKLMLRITPGGRIRVINAKEEQWEHKSS
jgi:hypothetical protein